MTNAAIKMNELEEKARSNRANERENKRSNKARERENERSNQAREYETNRANRAKEKQEAKNYRQRAFGDVFSVVSDWRKGLRDTVDKVAKFIPFKSLGNDPKFYTLGQEQLVSEITPTNVLTPMGNQVKFDTNVSADAAPNGRSACNYAKTGIVTHGYFNSVGYARHASDPVNKAANVLFTQIQKNTNYSKDYQAPDVMMMLLQQREIITLTHHIAKVFRLAQSNPVLNRYTPKDLVLANYVDYDDLVLRMANYKIRFALLLNAAKHVSIVDIPLLYRAMQLAGSTYYDEEDESQSAIHTFVPLAYGKIYYNSSGTIRENLKYAPTIPNWNSGVSLTTRPSMEDWLDKLEECINTLLADSTFKFITGDLERTFNKFFQITDVQFDVPQEHSHDTYMLNQISNMKLLPYGPDTTVDELTALFLISQDTNANGVLISTPEFEQVSGLREPMMGTHEYFSYVDLHDGLKPDPGAVIDATRLQPVFKTVGISSATEVVLAVHCGTEVVAFNEYYRYELDSDPEPVHVLVQDFMLSRNDSIDSAWHTVTDLVQVAGSINHRPVYLVYCDIVVSGGDFRRGAVARYGNLERVRSYTNEAFEYMNEAALYSLMGITSLA
nr:putative capsid [Marmot picobirnavirus]